ncbi:DUF7509 family protein [Natronobacterium gregoryi]|uniref:DUF7509 domain-containing protein n=2 Tax=Natronobacterium gregoryi TaxID=44930 RepID=L0AFX7_NATGS|nr:hypothetical protein [Natronobacterium gregoryi]AFZ72339.1 hypothetical protein Natgr_1111 [Natronobacterium gregoryi SP2]ELY64275.1 hypothetical protein C490_14840 [Natronobacterium gregoryi SP2]PLK20344.1 hypothetical protein CYV19_10300 [Natronobacterium gregoryi SP2]SFJ23140.1 hypothetical protein SAMN05443661_11858 [Natronobacterium gregoryi]
MRDRIVDELGSLPRSRFLVYLMGPYEAFDLENALEDADPEAIPESVDFGTLVGSDHDLERDEAALDLLLDVRDRLRTEAGVNAFLAIDVDVPLSELDAASQSIAFARASNTVVYVVPAVGDNLGVGIEVGAVLEALFDDEIADHHRERVLFVHESGVRSAMIAAVRDRWEARIYSYEDREDLTRQLRLFVRDLIRKERTGELPRLD